MGATFVGADNATGTTSVTVSVPSGVQDGDYLFFLVTAASTTTITFPAGITLITNGLADPGTNRNYALGYRVASSEPAGYTLTTSTGQCDFVCYAVRGLTGTPTVTSSVLGNASATTSLPCPTASLGNANDCTIYGFTGYTLSGAGTQTLTLPGGSGLSNQFTGNNTSLGDVTALAMAQPGVTGLGNATCTTGIIYADFLIDIAVPANPLPGIPFMSAWPGYPVPSVFVPGQLIQGGVQHQLTLSTTVGVMFSVLSENINHLLTLTGTVAAAATTKRVLTRLMTALLVVSSVTGRSISRGIMVFTAAISAIPRQAGKTLTGKTSVTPATATQKFKTVTLAATTAVTSVITRKTGKSITGQAAVSPATSKAFTRTIVALTSVLSTLSVTKVQKIALSVVLAVNSNVQRKVLPTITVPITLIGGTTRLIGRPIQGTLVIAGQTARTIGRGLASIIAVPDTVTISKAYKVTVTALSAVTGKITRKVGFTQSAKTTVQSVALRGFFKTFTTTVAAIVNFTAASGPKIFGNLFIIIPGSCAKIIKGLFTQTLPNLIMKLTGFPGTISTFHITLPNPASTGTMGRNRLRMVIPPLKTTLTGFPYPPLKIQLPVVAVTLTGKPGHNGPFNIDFGNCADMWAYLMSPVVIPETVQAPEDVNWVIGGTPVTRWATGIAGSRWSIGKFGAFNQSQLSTDYIRVGVSAVINNAKYNPTGDVVKFAFMPNSVQLPQVADWHTGSWETTSSIIYPYKARCLVGPNGVISLQPGSYVVYVQIADNPETVVSPLGMITVF